MGTKIQRSYSLEEKENAIVLVYKLDSYASASKKSGIPQTTIKQWMKKADEGGEQAEIRRNTREEVIKRCWALQFRVLVITARQIEHFEKQFEGDTIDPKLLTPEAVRTTAEIGEKISRQLKNIGAVATKHEVTGAIDHLLKDGRVPTAQALQELGRQRLLTEGNKRN